MGEGGVGRGAGGVERGAGERGRGRERCRWGGREG